MQILLRRFELPLWQFATRITGDRERARDVVQETFVKFQNDLSYQQIAEITKTTANNVGVLIHTALKTLRQRYAHAAKDFVPFTPRINEI